MATLTTLPVGFGYFFGYFPTVYAVEIGQQSKYDALSDSVKSGIKWAYSDVASFNAWLNSTTLTEPLTIILLEPLDTSTIPSSKDGFPVTVQIGFLKSFDFGFNFNF